MRVLAVVALALLLASCNGDRMKQDNTGQPQPQSWWAFPTHDAL